MLQLLTHFAPPTPGMPERSDGNPGVTTEATAILDFYIFDEIKIIMQLSQDQYFENNDFTIEPLPKGEYEHCTFQNCNFTSVDLSNYIFIDCSFVDANLSLVKLSNTIFRDIKFKGCKMIGLQFGDANAFGLSMSFDECILTNASFYKTKIKKTKFSNAKLNEVDFTEADLSESVFSNCDLHNSIFSATNLERVDFRTAINYSIDINQNKIKKSKHFVSELRGLLDQYGLIIE